MEPAVTSAVLSNLTFRKRILSGVAACCCKNICCRGKRGDETDGAYSYETTNPALYLACCGGSVSNSAQEHLDLNRGNVLYRSVDKKRSRSKVTTV